MKRKRSGGVNRPFKRPRSTAYNPNAAMSNTNRPSAPVPRLLASRTPASMIATQSTEVNSIDVGSSPISSVISTTETVNMVNIVLQGDSFYNRHGRKIVMKSLHLTGHIIPRSVTVADVAEYLRVLVVYDRQSNGASYNIAALLSDYDASGTITTTAYSNINMTNSTRFKILRDIRVSIPNNTGNATTALVGTVIDYTTNRVNINEFIRLGDLETTFKANNGNIGDISAGSLAVVTFGSVAAGTAGYKLRWNARLRYTE